MKLELNDYLNRELNKNNNKMIKYQLEDIRDLLKYVLVKW